MFRLVLKSNFLQAREHRTCWKLLLDVTQNIISKTQLEKFNGFCLHVLWESFLVVVLLDLKNKTKTFYFYI